MAAGLYARLVTGGNEVEIETHGIDAEVALMIVAGDEVVQSGGDQATFRRELASGWLVTRKEPGLVNTTNIVSLRTFDESKWLSEETPPVPTGVAEARLAPPAADADQAAGAPFASRSHTGRRPMTASGYTAFASIDRALTSTRTAADNVCAWPLEAQHFVEGRLEHEAGSHGVVVVDVAELLEYGHEHRLARLGDRPFIAHIAPVSHPSNEEAVSVTLGWANGRAIAAVNRVVMRFTVCRAGMACPFPLSA